MSRKENIKITLPVKTARLVVPALLCGRYRQVPAEREAISSLLYLLARATGVKLSDDEEG